MSWQHPRSGDDTPPRIYGVYDADATASVYEQYADPAAAHGWYESEDAAATAYRDEVTPADLTDSAYPTGPPYSDVAGPGDPAYAHASDDLISTAPLAAVPAHDPRETRADSAVFVDGSGRRRRAMRRVAVGMGAACVVFLGVVIAGLFGSGPAGGPLPWGHGKDDGKAPHAEHSPSAPATKRPGAGSDTDAPGATGGSASGAPSPGASGSAGASGSPGASGSAGDSSGAAKATAPATREAPTTTAPSTTAPARGNADDNPGRGQASAPGSTKGPK